MIQFQPIADDHTPEPSPEPNPEPNPEPSVWAALEANPPTLRHDALLEDFFNTNIPPHVLAKSFNLSPRQLAAWAESPRTRADIEALAAVTRARTAAIAAEAHAAAIRTLAEIASLGECDCLCRTGSAGDRPRRLAASLLLRHAKPPARRLDEAEAQARHPAPQPTPPPTPNRTPPRNTTQPTELDRALAPHHPNAYTPSDPATTKSRQVLSCHPRQPRIGERPHHQGRASSREGPWP